ncbi:jg9039 [Pararge aegeria aegeria]|uniref:Jg9039 protein n=1 Tax=Pararge aegeria aegeria TaxID=348720 RepID=A0A8S4RBY8_9NEOP|nr:jg9039 [Pararge aegeria aegeria]
MELVALYAEHPVSNKKHFENVEGQRQRFVLFTGSGLWKRFLEAEMKASNLSWTTLKSARDRSGWKKASVVCTTRCLKTQSRRIRDTNSELYMRQETYIRTANEPCGRGKESV